MELLTSVQIQNHWGYRDFEVRNMDITDYEEKYDVLIISAFKGSYIPTPKTLVEAIYKKWGINLEKLSENPFYDFRKNMGAWIAEVPIEGVPFRYLLCVEIIGNNHSLEHSFLSIFGILSAIEAIDSSVSFNTVVSPLLGTGSQGIPVSSVSKTLIKVFDQTKDNVRTLKKIVVIERDKSKAEKLLQGVDEILSRKIKLKLPEEMIQRVRPSLISILEKLGSTPKYQKWSMDMKEQLNRELIDVFTIGNLGRRIIEIIISEIYEKEKKKEKELKDLYEKISNLSQLKYSQWFIEYLHIMRIFGNESSHEKRNEDRLPRQLSKDDLSVLMMCMVRVLEIWVEKERDLI